MARNKEVRKVAIIGTGVIGASWAALYLAHDLDVVATDIAPNAEPALRHFVDDAWPALTKFGLAVGASRDRLKFSADLHQAIEGADLVQENGPEKRDFKIKLFADLDASLPVTTILASSSSGIPMTVIQSACKNPGRCVIGHPFNPPHLMPLVEVVGGEKTSPDTIARTMDFYASLGKKPIHIRKEMKGFVANRLQAALWREVFFLPSEGVADVAAVDDAVSWGPGLRWGLMGPNMLAHLGGGQGGIQHAIDHLFAPMTTWWATSDPVLTPDLKKQIADGTLKLAGNRSIEELERERDTMLLELLSTRAKGEKAAQMATAAGGGNQPRNKSDTASELAAPCLTHVDSSSERFLASYSRSRGRSQRWRKPRNQPRTNSQGLRTSLPPPTKNRGLTTSPPPNLPNRPLIPFPAVG